MRFSEKDCAQQVAECMTLIYKRGLTTSSGGNVSLKDEEGYIWMSPAGVDKANVQVATIPKMDFSGKSYGSKKPTSEWMMHLEIYKQRSSVNAVIHAHSQNLMMFVVSSILPIYNHIPYVHNFLGGIAQIPYLLCGSEELALSCGRVVKENPNAYSFILRNHGILVIGSTLEEAFCRLELLCRMATVWIRSKCVPPRSVDISGYSYSLPELSVHDEQYDQYYKELEKCTQRLYESRYICGEQLLSICPDANSGIIHCSSPGECPSMTQCSGYSISFDSIKSKRLHLHQLLYQCQSSYHYILDCVPENSSVLLYMHKPVCKDLVPESAVITGPICYIENTPDWENEIINEVKKNHRVFLIEGYGVIILADSTLQAIDQLEIVEASARATIDGFDNGVVLERMSDEDVRVIKHTLGPKFSLKEK